MSVSTEGHVTLNLTIPEYLVILGLLNHHNSEGNVQPCPVHGWAYSDRARVTEEEADDLIAQYLRKNGSHTGLWGRVRDAGVAQIHRVPAGVVLQAGAEVPSR